jgi:hypothetical protein
MRIIVLLTFIHASFVFCQIRPSINFGYGALLYDYRFQEYQFGLGAQINSKVFSHINYRYIYYEFDMTPEPWDETIKNGVISLTGGYRFLGQKRLSPLIILDVGMPLHSNANEALIMGGATIVKTYYPGVWRYNRGLFFGKLKVMSDIKVKSFNILIGASFNLWYWSVSELESATLIYSDQYVVSATRIGGQANFGLEAGLMYTFPGKKDKRE